MGELADQAGLTVRAMHHFDQIGLLRHTERSAATRGALSSASWTYLERAFAVGFTVPPS